MTPRRPHTTLPAGLAVGLALAFPPLLPAQSSVNNPGMSSGSGSGTGAGNAFGGNTSGAPTGRIGPRQALPGRMPPGGGAGSGIPLGPGATTTFPGDPSVFSNSTNLMANQPGTGDVTLVLPIHLQYAAAIPAAGDRSLAYQRLANTAIFANQLPVAGNALADASTTALQMPPGLERDQRLIAIITSLINLSDAHLREGKVDIVLPDAEAAPEPLAVKDRVAVIGRAQEEWRHAEALAEQVTNPTYRVEMIYRVVDNSSYGSQTIINEFPRPENEPSGNGGANPERPTDTTQTRAGAILLESAQWALRIERPVWRDRALVTIAQAASASRQFARGLDVARMIPQPEVRTDALVRIAESQARRNDAQGATSTYAEAARAVASIPLDDPRAVLTGVLIDNLISVGRFEDARSTVVLYPDRPRQLIALGAVAESQGRRGRADAAYAWINREVPPNERPTLERRVLNGVIAAIEQNRSRDISNRSQ